MEKRLIITIDGPSGVGKSTIAKLVAKKMGFLYVDTGAIYRAITWKALQSNIDLKNEELLLKMIVGLKIEFKHIEYNKNNYYKIFLDKIDVTRKIRGPRIDQYVSDLAKLPKIREQLISLQRNLAKDGNIVMEGRDIGSKILSNADIKLYFTALEGERVTRRYRELKNKGFKVSYDEVKKQLVNRDSIDSRRKCSPLKKTKDAIVIDSTNKSINEVMDIILNIVKNYRKNGKE